MLRISKCNQFHGNLWTEGKVETRTSPTMRHQKIPYRRGFLNVDWIDINSVPLNLLMCFLNLSLAPIREEHSAVNEVATNAWINHENVKQRRELFALQLYERSKMPSSTDFCAFFTLQQSDIQILERIFLRDLAVKAMGRPFSWNLIIFSSIHRPKCRNNLFKLFLTADALQALL